MGEEDDVWDGAKCTWVLKNKKKCGKQAVIFMEIGDDKKSTLLCPEHSKKFQAFIHKYSIPKESVPVCRDIWIDKETGDGFEPFYIQHSSSEGFEEAMEKDFPNRWREMKKNGYPYILTDYGIEHKKTNKKKPDRKV